MDIKGLFRRKNRDQVEYAKVIAHALQTKGIDQYNIEKENAASLLLVQDKELLVPLKAGMFKYGVVKNEKGEISVQAVSPDYDGQAIMFMSSPLLRVSNIDKKEAEHELKIVKRNFINIEMNSVEQDYVLGKGNLFEAQYILSRQAILDSVGGKKAILTKVTPHITRVETGEAKKGESII